MSMERAAWMTMYRMTRGTDQAGRGLRPGTVRRTLDFVRRYKGKLLFYLVLSVVGAFLGVASPILAGDVVDAIVSGGTPELIIRLALLIALVAVLDAILGVVTRWLSSDLGERIIYDLRTAVFDHVQTMPIAFFMRTRTGALVSRLNNDVIGAQTAISRTLSGVVMNVVSLVLTLVVMLTTSWQVTLVSLVLLPLFLIPARFMGGKIAELSRSQAQSNATMGDQMTERFSAAGATLVKLFGNPARESAEFASRADRVRAVGVGISVRQSVFMTALTLVSALALAAVYGIGGLQALARLDGYATGGTVHLIANNQVGFTTDPAEGRSTRYSSDLAKGFDIPIVHVNADDPEAAICAIRLAMAYRQEFGHDIVVDLIGYRRFGHNEQDEAAYTQPLMVGQIAAQPTVREQYAAQLVEEGVVTAEQ
ncbi:MAG: transporter ATP-binding protein, partial [Citricoccus sp.]|nr:transporter ATP-binding protein [Citricoccus sp. WCRC_4]